MGWLISVSAGTVIEPPPMPIIVEIAPITVGITPAAGVDGTFGARIRSSSGSNILIATSNATTPNMPVSAAPLKLLAIKTPATDPNAI